MKKVVRLTESDLARIVKRVINENSAKDDLIQMIKTDGWKSEAELVGGIENLMKILKIETPMDFLNLYNDLDIVRSEKYPDWTLFRYKPRHNLMVYNQESGVVYFNDPKIWSFLMDIFELNYDDIQVIIKVWLGNVYNLRGVNPEPKSKSHILLCAI
jgi:hypothetical protein